MTLFTLKHYQSVFLFFVFLTCIPTAYSTQRFQVKDGTSISIKASANDLTRIAIKGEIRIEKAWGSLKDLEIKSDTNAGDIYIKPRNPKKATSFFIRDSQGSTYTIIVTPQNIPSQTVILNPRSKYRSKIGHKSTQRSRPYIKEVKELIRTMTRRQEESNYYTQELNEVIPLWKETKITLKMSYVGDKYLGEIYLIKNISGREMILHESEFLNFGSGVRAVGIENLTLLSGQETHLYVVRQSQNEDD